MCGGRLSSSSFPTQVCPLMGGCEVWAVTEGQVLTESGSPDLCGHSGPSPCHQLIVTVKFRSCFPNLLCPWACHPRTLMTFCVPAGKHGVIFTLSTPSFVTDPATCMALTLHFLHQLPLVLSLSLFLPVLPSHLPFPIAFTPSPLKRETPVDTNLPWHIKLQQD